MSDINITIETNYTIEPCPTADKLEIAKILGTQTVVPKGQYQAGQYVVYFPPDICLPPNVSKSAWTSTSSTQHSTGRGSPAGWLLVGCGALCIGVYSTDAEPKNNVILFGESYGPGVQDMDYGVPAGEIGWRCYDCSVNGRYLDWGRLVSMCLFFGVPMVPVLYTGPFYASLVDELTNGPTTVVDPSTVKAKFRGREGIVITSQSETFSDVIGGRLILKSVSADYRDRKGARDDGEL